MSEQQNYDHVTRQNTEVFDASTMLRLGIYVYALRDPDTGHVFYVGKGGGTGTAESGNGRILAHFDEAESWLNARAAGLAPPAKLRSILDVWKKNRAVEWFIIRHNLRDAEEALNVESALIDFAPLSRNGPLTNAVLGVGCDDHGVLDQAEVAAFRAPAVSPGTPHPSVFVFQIKKALAQGRSPYEAVRRAWKSNELVGAAPHTSVAVGVADGISRVVVDIEKWAPVAGMPGKWEFSGTVMKDSELLNRSFAGIIARAPSFMWGTYLGVDFDGKGGFRFFRGTKDRTVHACEPQADQTLPVCGTTDS